MAKPDVAQPDERERQAKALEMRLAGMPWAAIAEHLGYADPSGPFRAVAAVLNRQESEAAGEYRKLEDMRLDVALRKVWPGVIAGDLKAIETWLKVHDRRVKLHGLAMPEKVVLQTTGMDLEAFTTRVEEDLRALGIDPVMDVPLMQGDGTWANT
ncbi:hypothetical protein [Nocardia nova]|uniref:hypothetical protein n=1 Tax=Nocardia nova TaxID=37330 RepID=UPI002738B96A|nr:hypothetical protein [Nocardia nova]